jgi:hypothetical protein
MRHFCSVLDQIEWREIGSVLREGTDALARSRLFLSHHHLDVRGIRLMTERGGLTGNRGGLDASRPFGHCKKQSEHRGKGSCHPSHV